MSADASLLAALPDRLSPGLDPVRDDPDQARGTQDLRTIGSGNIGATNVLRTGRKGLAAATLIGDMLEGHGRRHHRAATIGGPKAAMVAALGAFLGHLFPVWLKFQRRQGRRDLSRRAARPVLAGGADLRRDLARHRLHHALLVAVGADRRAS